MAIDKKYSHDNKVCQVTFTLGKEICENFQEISIVGDFNSWDPHQNKFSHVKSDGSSSVEIVLESGREYQFRYLCDGETWLNEKDADKEYCTHFGDAKNSVIVI